jgi:hypothetical protein
MDFDVCNLLSSGDVIYKERWWHWHKLVTDLFYDFVSILLVANFKMNEKVYAHSLLSIGWSRFIPEQYFFCDDKKFPAENNKTYLLIHCISETNDF